MSDRSLARFTRPHEPNLDEVVLSRGERLPVEAVKRILDALQVAAAYLQAPNGSFIAVRPQPDLARAHLTTYLEELLNAEVQGRADVVLPVPDYVTQYTYDAKYAATRGGADAEEKPLVIQPGTTAHGIRNEGSTPLTVLTEDFTGVYSSPRERAHPTRRFDATGAPY